MCVQMDRQDRVPSVRTSRDYTPLPTHHAPRTTYSHNITHHTPDPILHRAQHRAKSQDTTQHIPHITGYTKDDTRQPTHHSAGTREATQHTEQHTPHNTSHNTPAHNHHTPAQNDQQDKRGETRHLHRMTNNHSSNA